MNNKMVWLLVVLVCGNLALTAYVALPRSSDSLSWVESLSHKHSC